MLVIKMHTDHNKHTLPVPTTGQLHRYMRAFRYQDKALSVGKIKTRNFLIQVNLFDIYAYGPRLEHFFFPF